MISKTNIWEVALLYFDVGTVSQTVRSGNGPYKEKYHAQHKKKGPGIPEAFQVCAFGFSTCLRQEALEASSSYHPQGYQRPNLRL